MFGQIAESFCSSALIWCLQLDHVIGYTVIWKISLFWWKYFWSLFQAYTTLYHSVQLLTSFKETENKISLEFHSHWTRISFQFHSNFTPISFQIAQFWMGISHVTLPFFIFIQINIWCDPIFDIFFDTAQCSTGIMQCITWSSAFIIFTLNIFKV